MTTTALRASASLPRIRCRDVAPVALEVDALVVAVTAGPAGAQPLPGTDWADAALGAGFADVLNAMCATGRLEECTRMHCLGATQARTLVAVGLGPASDRIEPDALRRAIGAAMRSLRGSPRIGLVLPEGLETRGIDAAAEGALLGAYSFDGYRTTEATSVPVDEITVSCRASEMDLESISAVVNAVALARDLVNTPSGDLGPAELAAVAEREAIAVGAEVEILDEHALLRGGYGGILGVGRGSTRGPRLVRITWQPANPRTRVALVGKGITFDSGGLSLKPTIGMQNMKCDMAGAAAVLGAVLAAAALRLPIAVTGWLCLAENMPSGSATRIGDVLTMYGGQRVEVMNTDAEGRLVLADGLARAAQDKPDLLIDAATLTGAQMQALGNRTAGIMGNDENAIADVAAAARQAGEAMWPMPMPEELKLNLKSHTADLVNLPPGESRAGGMLTAAHFLNEFVPPHIPWAHIDLAGPSWNREDDHGFTPKGGTGFAVQTLLELLKARAAAD